MGSSLILTDNSAQFTRPNFPGFKHLNLLEESIEFDNGVYSNFRELHVSGFPKKASASTPVRVVAPSIPAITNQITTLVRQCDDLFIMLISSELNQTFTLCEEIVENIHGRAAIHLIDTKAFSIGQGQIIQFAAELIHAEKSGSMIDEKIRQEIPHIYSLLTTPNFSYLQKSGFIDIGQSVSGEMLSFMPIFNLDGGRLIPVEKVKNIRSVIDYFIEFLDEFEDLKSVAVIQPYPAYTNETKLIRQHVDEFFPEAQYSEHSINPYLASLIGPQGFSIVVKENSQP